MTKQDLAIALRQHENMLTISDASEVVDLFFDKMTEALRKGEAITIRGFGTISTKVSPAREGHNPKTMEPVHIPAKVKPRFKPSKALTDALNPAPAPQALRAGPPTVAQRRASA